MKQVRYLYNYLTHWRVEQNISQCDSVHCAKKTIVRQVTTMLAISRNVLFPGHNHLLTTGTDYPFTLITTLAGVQVIIKVMGHQNWWLAGGYDLEERTFLKVANMVVTW